MLFYNKKKSGPHIYYNSCLKELSLLELKENKTFFQIFTYMCEFGNVKLKARCARSYLRIFTIYTK